MDLRKFYEDKGIDYDNFVKRMMGKESLVEKYIEIFISDPTYSELERVMEKMDYAAAVFKAHTLKGIAINLSFDKLGNLCSDMVDSGRGNNTQKIIKDFELVREEYFSILKGLGRA